MPCKLPRREYVMLNDAMKSKSVREVSNELASVFVDPAQSRSSSFTVSACSPCAISSRLPMMYLNKIIHLVLSYLQSEIFISASLQSI